MEDDQFAKNLLLNHTCDNCTLTCELKKHCVDNTCINWSYSIYQVKLINKTDGPLTIHDLNFVVNCKVIMLTSFIRFDKIIQSNDLHLLLDKGYCELYVNDEKATWAVLGCWFIMTSLLEK